MFSWAGVLTKWGRPSKLNGYWKMMSYFLPRLTLTYTVQGQNVQIFLHCNTFCHIHCLTTYCTGVELTVQVYREAVQQLPSFTFYSYPVVWRILTRKEVIILDTSCWAWLNILLQTCRWFRGGGWGRWTTWQCLAIVRSGKRGATWLVSFKRLWRIAR